MIYYAQKQKTDVTKSRRFRSVSAKQAFDKEAYHARIHNNHADIAFVYQRLQLKGINGNVVGILKTPQSDDAGLQRFQSETKPKEETRL